MNNKQQIEHIAFLESVIDKLILCVTTVGGNTFISREEFNKAEIDRKNLDPDADDYSYENYIVDSFDDLGDL